MGCGIGWRRGVLACIVGLGWALTAFAKSPFTGVWRGKHHGETYLIIEIPDRPTEPGSILGRGVEFGNHGEIRRVRKEERVEYGNVAVREQAGVVVLRYLTEDGKTVEFEMRLESPQKASLRVVGAPPEVHSFRLQREK
jgi:hypothetical protein